jgi:phosphoesterase RecJ-like protein
VTVHELTRAIARARTVLLTAPVDLDGDAVGALLALDRAIRQRWPSVRVRIVADEAVPARYDFLEGARERFRRAADVAVEPVDLALVCDGDPGRLGAATPHYEAARIRGQIDHHKSSDPRLVDVSLIDPEAASTTELVLQLCDHWGVPVDATLAAAIYAGMAFDTHVFRYRLTRPKTLRAAARLMETGIDHSVIVERVLLDQPLSKQRLRGAMLARMEVGLGGRLAWAVLSRAETNGVESGGLVDDLVFIEGVEVGALLIDRGDGRVKASLRSRGGVDVSLLARSLSERGGGHARAAGATIEGTTTEVVARLTAYVAEALGAGRVK